MTAVHIDELEWVPWQAGDRFGGRRKQPAKAAGGKQLGFSLHEVEPGFAAWPAHMHFVNEEALYVLEGHGTLRLGADEFPKHAHLNNEEALFVLSGSGVRGGRHPMRDAGGTRGHRSGSYRPRYAGAATRDHRWRAAVWDLWLRPDRRSR